MRHARWIRIAQIGCCASMVLAVRRGAAQPGTATPPIPKFDAGMFRAAAVTNPFFPLEPGAVFVYAVREGTRRSVDSIVVTQEQKRVGGVAVVVVHDWVTRGGKIVEDTRDWYAQDTAGTVWYLGEVTKSYEGKTARTNGSWQHGVAGAHAGIIMPTRPIVGVAYRQEYRKGVAEDMGRVVALDDSVTVPAGHYSGCITTEDWSPLEPEIMERKTYCRGVGVVREKTTKGGSELVELVSVKKAQSRQ